MILLLLFILFGMGVGVYLSYNREKSPLINILRCLGGFVAGHFSGLIVGAIFVMIIGFFIKTAHPEWVEYSTAETIMLENIQDNYSASGSFFLGSGTFNNQSYYTYYKQVGVDKFKLEKLKSDICYINYIDSDEVPRIERIERSLMTNWGLWSGDKTYEIYVPRGSIKSVFNLDAK